MTEPDLPVPDVPAKVTIAWLIEHVPASLYAWAFGIGLALFALGVTAGQTTFFRQLYGLAEPVEAGSEGDARAGRIVDVDSAESMIAITRVAETEGMTMRISNWGFRPPGEIQLRLAVDGDTSFFSEHRIIAMCHIRDSRFDPMEDPRTQVSETFRVSKPEMHMAVPLAHGFVTELVLSGRRIGCFIGALPPNISARDINVIGDVERLGGIVLPASAGMTVNGIELTVDPDAPPEVRERLEKLIEESKQRGRGF